MQYCSPPQRDNSHKLELREWMHRMSGVSEIQVGSGDERAADASQDVPRRLRQAREQAGLSLRELARRLEISPSALSQIETGKSRPSVNTLYALVSHLNLSLDELFDNPAAGDRVLEIEGGLNRARPWPPREGGPAGSGAGPLQHAGDRAHIDLDSGVRWERLTREHDPHIDFLEVTYEPGGASNPRNNLVRHAGHEYGVVLRGTIDVTVGFETYRCGPGDSISFSSNEPHLLANHSDEPAVAIWFVIGRRGSDPRQPNFDGE
jgi:transcriptional regulator with XRE-family HTH domain